MALMLANVFVGFLWAIGLVAVFGRLVAWRWPANKRGKKKKGEPTGRRVSPGAFLGAVGGSIAVSLMIANVLLGIVSAVIGASAGPPAFVSFLVGAVGALVLRRDRLPPFLYAAGVAVREFLTERVKTQEHRASAQDRAIERRFREPVSTVVDAPVTPIIRTVAPLPEPQPDLPPIMVTIPAPRRDDQALLQRRRNIVRHLKARSATLSANAPPRAPAIPPAAAEPVAAVLASQAAATIAETRATHDIWRAEAEALREQWRKDGEAMREQWRRDTQVKVGEGQQSP